MDIQERINELMKQKEFAEAFAQAQTPEEVVDLFHKKDIEVPLETAKELFELDYEGELDEEALESVSGGGWLRTLVAKAYYGAGYLGGRLAGWDKKKSKEYAKKCEVVGSVLGWAAEKAI